ncbi:MAG: nuclear transport factor 2 family protein [Thermomicrobiales bacterium]
MHDLKETLLAIERRFWDAPPNTAVYQEAFADAGLMVLPMEDGILDKSQVIESVRLSSAWTSYELSNVQLLHMSAGCEALIYQARAERSGQVAYRALITSIYRETEERWIMVFHQQTPMP